jgi:hypothetical protein
MVVLDVCNVGFGMNNDKYLVLTPDGDRTNVRTSEGCYVEPACWRSLGGALGIPLYNCNDRKEIKNNTHFRRAC